MSVNIDVCVCRCVCVCVCVCEHSIRLDNPELNRHKLIQHHRSTHDLLLLQLNTTSESSCSDRRTHTHTHTHTVSPSHTHTSALHSTGSGGLYSTSTSSEVHTVAAQLSARRNQGISKGTFFINALITNLGTQTLQQKYSNRQKMG